MILFSLCWRFGQLPNYFFPILLFFINSGGKGKR